MFSIRRVLGPSLLIMSEKIGILKIIGVGAGVTGFWFLVAFTFVIPTYTQSLNNQIESLQKEIAATELAKAIEKEKTDKIISTLEQDVLKHEELARQNIQLRTGDLFAGGNILPVGHRNIQFGDSAEKIIGIYGSRASTKLYSGVEVKTDDALIPEIMFFTGGDDGVHRIRYRFESEGHEEYILESLSKNFNIEIEKSMDSVSKTITYDGSIDEFHIMLMLGFYSVEK